MNLFNFPVKKPVTVVMLMLMILVVGGIALWKIPLNMMPDIEFPNLVVLIQYPGAGPEEVEERIAKPLEGMLKSISDVENIKIIAMEDQCVFIMEFNWGTDLDAAAADIREAISVVRKYLPEDMEEPLLVQMDLSDMPIMFLSVSDPKRPLLELKEIADDSVSPQLERLPGVASAMVMGGREREIQVNLDKDKLKSYNLSTTDIIQAIAYQNLNVSSGYFEEGIQRFRLRGVGEFNSLEELENLYIGKGITSSQMQEQQMMALLGISDPSAGEGAISPIRLKDVGEVKDGVKEVEGSVKIQGDDKVLVEGVGIIVMKESDANPVKAADEVIKAIPSIERNLPEGLNLFVNFNITEMITDSLSALRSAAYEGAVFAVLVLLVFLWRIRPTIIVATAIPLSLLLAFVGMYFTGFTLNIITMAALVIAIGKLVDDSIVVMENIFRHISAGEQPHQAAEQGFREVAIAVTAATIVTVIIFLPIAFISGLSSQLFSPFAATIFFALLGSLIVSFTLVPMMSSRILKVETPSPGKRIRHPFERIQESYGSLLAWSLSNKGKVFVLVLLVLGVTGLMASQLPQEFMAESIGYIYQAKASLPAGTVVEETEKLTEKVRDKVNVYPDLERLFMMVGKTGEAMSEAMGAMQGEIRGTHNATMMVMMKKKAEGRVTPESELVRAFEEFERENPGAEITFAPEGGMQSIGQESQKPIVVKLYGDDLDQLKTISERIAENMRDVEGVRDVTTTLEQGAPEVQYSFDRFRLGNQGMVMGMAAMAVQSEVLGKLASYYREGGKEYDIRVRLIEDQRDTFADIKELPLTSPLGFTLPLRDSAEFNYDVGPMYIRRENSKRLVIVEANKSDRALSEIIGDIKKVVAGMALPEGYHVKIGGEYEDMMESFQDLGILFVLAIILVYMVLASLYESLMHPLTIMIAIPFAITGAAAGLYFTNTGFGVMAFLGLIMLVGIVATNSIVLIDFVIIFHHERGMERRQAVIEAGKTRLRPILMTAFTTMLGVLPIAIGHGEGMEMMQPLGIVVVGGLFTATLLTLIIIPVVYEVFDDLAIDLANLFRRKKPEYEAETKS
jgi:HAE1 family hydrophobic/amphiphilic exporter-1